MNPTLKYFKMHPEVFSPEFATWASACFDLKAFIHPDFPISSWSTLNYKTTIKPYIQSEFWVDPGSRVLIPTGLIFDIPQGYSVRLHIRSSLAAKCGITLANAEGVIDSDYVEEVFVILWNISENAVTITSGDRIAQAELVKSESYSVAETFVRPIPKTNRTGGMGSTGINTVNNIVKIIRLGGRVAHVFT